MNSWCSVSPPPGCPDPTVAPSTTTSHPSTDRMSPTETIINPVNTNKPVKPTSSQSSGTLLIKISVFHIRRYDLYCFLWWMHSRKLDCMLITSCRWFHCCLHCVSCHGRVSAVWSHYDYLLHSEVSVDQRTRLVVSFSVCTIMIEYNCGDFNMCYLSISKCSISLFTGTKVDYLLGLVILVIAVPALY